MAFDSFGSGGGKAWQTPAPAEKPESAAAAGHSLAPTMRVGGGPTDGGRPRGFGTPPAAGVDERSGCVDGAGAVAVVDAASPLIFASFSSLMKCFWAWLLTWGSVRVGMQLAIFVHLPRPWTSIKSRNCWCSCFDQRPFCLLGAT